MRNDGELDALDMSFLKSKRIVASTADGGGAGSWTVWRCLSGEFSVGGDTFILDEGEFYAVEGDFLNRLNTYIATLRNDVLDLPASNGVREGPYNEKVVEGASGEMLLMDRRLVPSPERGDRLELCDILTSRRQLIHVKRHLGSSDLSHLFAQGLNSAELLQESSEFCRAAHERIREQATDGSYDFFARHPIVTGHFEVVYAIVADWRGRPLEDALPFFSKMTLRHVAQQLTNRGYGVSCLPVPVVDGAEAARPSGTGTA